MFTTTKRFLQCILTAVFIFSSNVMAQDESQLTKQLSSNLFEIIGAAETVRVLSLVQDSKDELGLSFQKNPKREEAFTALIGDCIRLLDGLDYVPQACKTLFGAFPEVDRVFSYVLQVKLGDSQSAAVFPREFNLILNGLICGLCPTATCETPLGVPNSCDSF